MDGRSHAGPRSGGLGDQMTQHGFRVLTRDGEFFGRLAHVAGDIETGRPAGLVVHRNGQQYLLPLNTVLRHEANEVVLRGYARDYEDLPPFTGAGYRLIDREIEREETLRWMKELGVEDYQIGEEELDETMPNERPLHTGAENPHRVPIKKNGKSTSPIASDPTDMNEPNEEMRERTRSDKH